MTRKIFYYIFLIWGLLGLVRPIIELFTIRDLSTIGLGGLIGGIILLLIARAIKGKKKPKTSIALEKKDEEKKEIKEQPEKQTKKYFPNFIYVFKVIKKFLKRYIGKYVGEILIIVGIWIFGTNFLKWFNVSRYDRTTTIQFAVLGFILIFIGGLILLRKKK